MEWRKHYDLAEKHAVLSPSGYHWINYTPEKMKQVYMNMKRKEKGTMLHAFASISIKEGIRLANHKKALNQFVNDAIGFDMESELVLFYSENCFGTADAIQYYEKDNLLRIHDLKTGTSPPSMNQLAIYGALFCLEYNKKPHKHDTLCRIYQGNGFVEELIDPDFILDIMQSIIQNDKVIEQLKLTV